MKVVCWRCHEHTDHYARGLCTRCYNAQYRHGTFDVVVPFGKRRYEWPLVCICANPLVERLPLWGSHQCTRCLRYITPERIEELDNGESK